MLNYIIKRIILLIPTVFIIISINFFIIEMIPGSPVQQAIAKIKGLDNNKVSNIETNKASNIYEGINKSIEEKIKEQFGFNKSLGQRYKETIYNLFTFNLGKSFYSDKKVIEIILSKLPVSISLGFFSTIFIYIVSIFLGISKVVKNESLYDRVTSIILIFFNTLPSFMLAVGLIIFFTGGYYLNILPIRGLTSDNFEELSFFNKVIDYVKHIILPTISLSLISIAPLTFFIKNSFLAELKKNYVVSLKAKGVGKRDILYKHIFRNALLIVIAGFPSTLIGVIFTGSILVEVIFSLDGLGLLGYESVLKRDYPVIFGTLFIYTVMGLLLNLINDICYKLVDPRIDFEK